MMRFWSVSLLSTLCLISQPIGAMTIDYDTVFPTVIQGHTDNMSSNCNSANASTLNITNSSLIKGGNSPTLNICKINTQSNNGNCVNSSGAVVACTTNGQNSQIPELLLDPFPENNSTFSPPTISNGAFVTLWADGVTDYNNITVDNATLTFSSVNSTYKIKNLLVRNGQAV